LRRSRIRTRADRTTPPTCEGRFASRTKSARGVVGWGPRKRRRARKGDHHARSCPPRPRRRSPRSA
jgi:hypothetical protein